MSLRSLVTSSVLCALPLVLVACGDEAPVDPRTQAPLVRTAVVEVAGQSSRSFTGTIAARVESDLGFRVSGKLLERLVEAGQSVKRGQVLMRIDPADLQLAAVAQAQAVASARARALQTAEEEARYRDLRGTGAISASAYDQAKAAADTASAQLKAAEAQYDLARNASRYTELLADSDGLIMNTLAEPGQVVAAGQAVVRLARRGDREAVIQLPETLRPAIGSGAQAFAFGRENLGVPAKLRQLSDAADPLTRTFEARYVLEGELANAPLGTTVTLQLADAPLPSQQEPVKQLPVFSVPIGALFDSGKGPGVWLVTGEPTQVSWHPVVIQNLDDEGAQLRGDLHQGDRIVALGAHLLRDGMEVRVANSVAVVTGGDAL
jgi:RND family efflux transporter MFP subunit